MSTTAANRLSVRLSPDKTKAFVVAVPSEEGSPPAREEIEAVLEGADVTFGVKQEAIDFLVAGSTAREPVLVAEGKEPIPGNDGWVEFLVGLPPPGAGADNGSAATAGEEKRIDMHERHLFHNVLKGDTIARIHPPRPGTPGMTVSGTTIPPRSGKPAVLHLGAHVNYADDKCTAVVASEDGAAVVSHQQGVEVKPVVTVSGNVDFSTGNIDFVGSLVVHGDVKSDFTVKVKKSLQVNGNVEDALIEAGGDVVIKKGFVGRGKGRITAGGSVNVHHILNQSIAAGADILVEQETVNGDLHACRRIQAPRAVVAGGSLEADQEIVVGTLGNSDGVQARVRLGRRGRVLEKIGQLEREIKHAEKQMLDVKDAVYRLIRQKIDAGTLGDEKEECLKKLQQLQKQLPAQIAAFKEEREKLIEELKQTIDARLTVRESVYENVVIEINGVKKIMDQSVKGVVFFERGGKLEAQSHDEGTARRATPTTAKPIGRS